MTPSERKAQETRAKEALRFRAHLYEDYIVIHTRMGKTPSNEVVRRLAEFDQYTAPRALERCPDEVDGLEAQWEKPPIEH